MCGDKGGRWLAKMLLQQQLDLGGLDIRFHAKHSTPCYWISPGMVRPRAPLGDYRIDAKRTPRNEAVFQLCQPTESKSRARVFSVLAGSCISRVQSRGPKPLNFLSNSHNAVLLPSYLSKLRASSYFNHLYSVCSRERTMSPSLAKTPKQY